MANFMVLTQKSTAATNLMTSFTPAPTVVRNFTQHTLWEWINPKDSDVATVQTSQPIVYASIQLPAVM